MEDLSSGHRKRLKERFIKAPNSVHDYELLELILFNAIPRRDVKPLAKKLVHSAENFARLLSFDETKLKVIDSKIPESVGTQLTIIRECIRRSLSCEMKEKISLSTGDAVKEYLQVTMANKDTESFRVLYLSTKNHIIADEIQEVGTVDQTQVYPREIVKRAIFHAASAIIIAHNHPSGIPTPSKADIIITAKIIEACKSIDVIVHDHVIVAGNKYFSFRSNNLI